MKTYNRLRSRLKAFVRCYVETGVGTKAMRAIGFKGTRPDVAAAKLLAKPKVAQAVEEFEASMQDEVKCRVYRSLNRLQHIAEFDVRELVDERGAPLPLKKLPDDVALAIQGVEVEELWEGRGEARVQVGNLHKYKLASKIEANKLIMQYQRVLVEKHEHSGPNGGPIQVQDADNLTDDQLEKLSPAEAAQHLLNRRRARGDVVTYAGIMEVPGRPLCDDPDTELFEPIQANLRAHDKLILQTMTRTADREFGRALILCPPGAAKTTNASIIWPSHRMGQYPGTRIALGSYGAELAQTMGRRTRSLIKQARYRAVFNTGLSRDAHAGDKFTLDNGSEYMADSISGSFPGHRFDGAIADDPVKGISQAQSETKRATTWDEFKANFMTRIVPTGWLAIIMTRWSEEDPAGHILPEDWNGDSGIFIGRHDGLEWEVLCLQAKCETTTDPLGRQIGEYLAPEWYPPKHWQQYESDPRDWNSLFQQRPRPIEGAFFHESDLLVDSKPIEMPQRVDFVFAIIDTAMKEGRAHDGLAVTFFARSKLNLPVNPPLAICDWDYTQINSALLIKWLPSVFIRLEELAKQTQAFGGVKGVFIEDKVSGTVLLAQVMQMPDWRPEWRCTPIDSKLTALGKKEKAFNASGHVAAGKVKWTRQAYERVVTFKGSTKNHLRSQILNVSMDTKDTAPWDCVDTFSYGIAMSLGNRAGF